MPSVQDLLHSLSRVILNYCDSPLLTISIEDKREETLVSEPFTFAEHRLPAEQILMDELVACIAKSNEKRRPVLNYVLHIIQKIQAFSKQSVPSDSSDPLAPSLQDEIAVFFCELQALIKTSQSSTTTIHCNGQQLTTHGLKKDILGFYQLNRLGMQIQNTLLAFLDVNAETSPTDLTKKIFNFFRTHQLRCLTAYNEQLGIDVQTLKNTLSQVQNELHLNYLSPTWSSEKSPSFFNPDITTKYLVNAKEISHATEDNELITAVETHQRLTQQIEHLKEKIQTTKARINAGRQPKAVQQPVTTSSTTAAIVESKTEAEHRYGVSKIGTLFASALDYLGESLTVADGNSATQMDKNEPFYWYEY